MLSPRIARNQHTVRLLRAKDTIIATSELSPAPGIRLVLHRVERLIIAPVESHVLIGTFRR